MKIRITKKGVKKFQGKVDTSQVGWHSNWEGYEDDGYGNMIPKEPQKFNTTNYANLPACPPGQTYSAIQEKCLTPEEAEAEKQMLSGFGSFLDKKKKGMPTNPFKTTGNEGTASNPMGAVIPQKPGAATTATAKQKSPYAKGYDFVMDPARKVQKALRDPFMQKIYGANAAVDGIVNLALPVAKYFDNQAKIKDAQEKESIARFNTLQAASKFRGNFTVNDGLFRPDDRGVNEGMFGNNFYAATMQYGGALINEGDMKIRITGVPDMAYGGQANYGLDLGRRKVYTDMSSTTSENVSSSMSQQSNAKEPYILEAEGGETIWRPDGTHFNITGKRHTENGEKLTEKQAPAKSFIFSDTKKMKIKDPAILAHFGVAYKKGGVTPAAIAKKFPLNEYKARLEDKTRQSDSIGMGSDEKSFKKNMQYLAELAVIQESMKGMPAPELSQALIGAAEDTAQMAYGGYVMPKYQGKTGSSTVDPTHGSRKVDASGNTTVYDAYQKKWVPDAEYLSRYNYDGTSKQGAAAPASTPKGDLGEWSDDYETLQKLLKDPKNAGLRKAMFENFKKDYKNSPLVNDPQGEEKFLQNFLEAQRQFMGIRAAYKDKPEELTAANWDRGGRNVRYNREAQKLGYTPMSEREIQRFQGGYRALAKAARDPQFFESFGKYFKLSPVGLKDEEFMGLPISRDDKWAGNTTIGEIAQLRMPYEEPQKKPDPQYVCDAQGKIVTVASGGYATPEEAAKHCPEKKKVTKYICKDGQVIESASGVGYDTPEQAGLNCGTGKQKEVPFDFLAPDKMNMAWKMNRMVPNIYLPEMYQLPRRQYPIAFDDWMSRVQSRQSTYNTAMDTAAKTNQSQAVGSFLAGLVGAQDVGDISQVNTGNLDRAERRSMADMEMDFKNDVFNIGQRQEYSKGLATAQQQYDNALNKGVSDYIQAYADAWTNRGDLYDINMRDQYFYRDPNTYKTEFKGAVGNVFGSNPGFGTNGAGGYESLGASANNMYKQFYESLTDIKDEARRSAMAERLVTNALASNRQTSNQTYDAYGMPKSSSRRTTQFNFSGS